jgi:uncharacterized protein
MQEYRRAMAIVESGTVDQLERLDDLIVAGAPLNLKGVNDWTPAHIAATRDDVEALRILVRHGADLSIRTANQV